MTKEEAIKIIHDYAFEEDACFSVDEVEKAATIAIDALSSPWISCTERMPKSGTDYIPFIDKWGNRYFGKFENGSWYNVFGGEFRVDYDDVIAWTVIPEYDVK